MQFLAIILLSVAAAVCYGVLHDQVTARVCLEYFTVFHPPVFLTESPTLLALGWGVIATWWVGLPLGVLLAAAARFGTRPKWGVRDLLRPLLTLLCAMGCAALLAGMTGYWAARSGSAQPPYWVSEMLPPARHAVFVADWWAHRMSYAAGALGGIGLSIYVTSARLRKAPDN